MKKYQRKSPALAGNRALAKQKTEYENAVDDGLVKIINDNASAQAVAISQGVYDEVAEASRREEQLPSIIVAAPTATTAVLLYRGFDKPEDNGWLAIRAASPGLLGLALSGIRGKLIRSERLKGGARWP